MLAAYNPSAIQGPFPLPGVIASAGGCSVKQERAPGAYFNAASAQQVQGVVGGDGHVLKGASLLSAAWQKECHAVPKSHAPPPPGWPYMAGAKAELTRRAAACRAAYWRNCMCTMCVCTCVCTCKGVGWARYQGADKFTRWGGGHLVNLFGWIAQGRLIRPLSGRPFPLRT